MNDRHASPSATSSTAPGAPRRAGTDRGVMVGRAAIERAPPGMLPAEGLAAPARPRLPLADETDRDGRA